MKNIERKTRNLVIRSLKASDYKAWKLSYDTARPPQNDWDQPARAPTEMSKEHFRKILENQKALREQDKTYNLAIFERKTGNFVGSVLVMEVVRGLAQTCFLGYFLLNNFWGRGYGKEAVLTLIDIAFRDLKLHRVEAGIEPNNRRSIMLARSIGLRKEGLKKRAVFLRGSWVDLVMYSATCDEFGIKWQGDTTSRIR